MDGESVEFDFEENLDQFYPGLRKPDEYEDYLDEKGKAVVFSPSIGFQSRYGKLVSRDWRGKKCQFFKNSDARVAHTIKFSDATYRSMDTLLNDLSEKMNIPFGVRSIHTPKTGSEINSIDELQHGRAYVCREFNKPRPLNLQRVWENGKWTNRKPLTSQENFSKRLTGQYLDSWWHEHQKKSGRGSSESRQMGFKPRSPKDEEEMLERTPKKITVYRNGCWLHRHLVLLNKRLKFRPAEEFFEALLQDVGEMFKMKFTKLLAADDYREVKSVKEVLEGPDVFIALQYNEDLIKPPGMLEPIGRMIHKGNTIDPAMADKSGVVRKGKSQGKWKLKVITSDEEGAGTTSNLTLWVYGEKRDSGPLPLPRKGEDHESFSAGSVEEFDIKAGKLGAIYKIRLESDYTGRSPDWKCVEVQMTDINTERSLLFPVDRWFSQSKEDGSTSREVAMAKKSGDPMYPTVTYEVLIATGDRWGAGTDAEPFITLFGERGDSGERKLIREQAKLKQAFGTRAQYKPFKKHQIDAFTIDAVSLGRLKKIKIGHDRSKAGEGWFLEKIAINVSDPRDGGGETKVFNFPCGRWLDSGQDDGKIAREIMASEQQTGIDAQKEIWEIEQWKYERGNELVFVSEASGKCLLIKGDATFHARGHPQDPFSVMVVKAKMQNGVRIIRSGLHSGYHLGIDKGKLYAEMKGGVHCEWKVLQQKDRAVCLQSVRNPSHYVSFDQQGNASLADSNVKSQLTFRVYCRGAFRHQGVIVVQTSATQTLFIDEDRKVVGYGVRDVSAYFRVHKVQKGVRMLQSIARPDCFIQMRDGVVDGNGVGDEACHFFVERNRYEGGSFRLLHVGENKYLGLTPEGDGMSASEEDVEDLVFYPEVIEYGVPKKKRPDFRSSTTTTPRILHIDTERSREGGGGTTRRSNSQSYNQNKSSSRMPTQPKTSNRRPSDARSPKSRTDPKSPNLEMQPEDDREEEPLSPGAGGQRTLRSDRTEDPKSPGAQRSQQRTTRSPARSPGTYPASSSKTPGVN